MNWQLQLQLARRVSMRPGIAKLIVSLPIGSISVLSFFIIRELGFVIYTSYFSPVSSGRTLYYTIWITSFFIATPLLFFIGATRGSMKWAGGALLIFIYFVFDSFWNNPLWGTLLVLSYIGALAVSFFLKFYFIKWSRGNAGV